MFCSWELYWASVEYRNWYCSVVWIIPPLHRMGGGGDYRLNMQNSGNKPNVTPQIKRGERGDCFHPPVQAKLRHDLQDVDLSGFSELLTADAAGYETPGPPYTCTERTRWSHAINSDTQDLRQQHSSLLILNLSVVFL